jgi:Trk-type K+ transport system membrane component
MSFTIRAAICVLLAVSFLVGCGGGSSSTSGGNRQYTLEITIAPDRINIEAGGSVVVRVSLFDIDGQPVADATILLTTTLGTLGASQLTTADDGTATTTLSPSDTTTVGNATVTATFSTITVYSDLIEFYRPLA